MITLNAAPANNLLKPNTEKNPAHRKQATDKCLLIGEQKEYFAEDGDIVFVKEY